MITEIAQATGQLTQLIDDLLHQTQTRRLDAATSQASQDVQSFKDDLLARRLDSINLRLGGLQHGILVHLTDAESQQLHAVVPILDGFALLGLYRTFPNRVWERGRPSLFGTGPRQAPTRLIPRPARDDGFLTTIFFNLSTFHFSP